MAADDDVNKNIESFFKRHRQLYLAWFRVLHRLAETSFDEVETSKFIFKILKKHCGSLKFSKGIKGLPTAVLAVFTPKHATQSPRLLRADIDALPIRGTDGTKARLNPDVHHACGHDGHVASLLMCAHWLHNFQELPRRKVVLFFQPAEERGDPERGGSGARIAIQKSGLLDTLHADVADVYALHCWPGLDVGEIGVGTGVMMGISGLIEVEMSGRGGHTAQTNEDGGDPLLAACTFVVSAQAVVARGADPFQPVSVSLSRIENLGSNAQNVIAPRVRILGTLRALDVPTRDSVHRQIRRHAEGAAAMHGCTTVVTFKDGYPATRNSAGGARVARNAAIRAVYGNETRVYRIGFGEGDLRPSLCAEDFSLLLEKRCGAYVWLGNGSEGGDLKESGFHFNEKALAVGGKFFVHIALSLSSRDEV